MGAQFPIISATVTKILEKPHKFLGKRKINAWKEVILSKVSWGDKHEAAFPELKETLKSAVKRDYLKEHRIVSAFTGALDKFWARLIT